MSLHHARLYSVSKPLQFEEMVLSEMKTAFALRAASSDDDAQKVGQRLLLLSVVDMPGLRPLV